MADTRISKKEKIVVEEISQTEILHVITQEIQRKSQKLLYNFGTKLQASVGLVFRPSMDTPIEVIQQMKQQLNGIRKRDENHYVSDRIPEKYFQEIFGEDGHKLKFDLMIAQRVQNAASTTDMYSQQVRFIGAKCEGKRQDDLQAVISSIKQDTALDLQDYGACTLYLGALPKNFYTGRVESRQGEHIQREVYSRAHIFIILDSPRTEMLKTNLDIIEMVKWVPFSTLLNIDAKTQIKERVIQNPIQLVGILPQFLQKMAERGVKNIVFLSLDIGMPRNMWGLHAAMVVYLMSIFTKGVNDRKTKQTYLSKYTPILDKWEAVFEKFSQTYTTTDGSIVANHLIQYYFKQWKNEFHKRYRQSDGIDLTFMMLISSTALFFALDCYYKTIGNSTKPSL